MSLSGNPPKMIEYIDIDPVEMMFWMYLPISVPGSHTYHLPENLKQFAPIISAAKADDPSAFFLRYVYLTAKTLWVQGDYIGNRPGWHIDGYGTDDVNYIWWDRASAEFLIVDPAYLPSKGLWNLSDDCDLSMAQMEAIARSLSPYQGAKVGFPDKLLLRLDNTCIHRSPTKFDAGMRTFVKVSLSHDRYDLKGNAVNHLLPETHWPLVDRQCSRNHPASTQ